MDGLRKNLGFGIDFENTNNTMPKCVDTWQLGIKETIAHSAGKHEGCKQRCIITH